MESRDTMEEVNETKASCLKESKKLKSLYLDEQITGETRRLTSRMTRNITADLT